MRAGYLRLCEYQNKIAAEADADLFLKKAFWVKIIRESDAYTVLRMSRPKLDHYFEIKGMQNLEEAVASGRPVILLSAHVGSFFTGAVALSQLGIKVYPVARSVDNLLASDRPTQFYMKLNLILSGMRLSPTRYIFEDFISGRFDRRIAELGRKGGIFAINIDLPPQGFPHNRHPVIFLGRRSSLPSGVVRWGVRKKAIFLTGWNCIEGFDNCQFHRSITVEAPIFPDNDAGAVLQTYADRLSDLVFKQPWQWMYMPNINDYAETSKTDGSVKSS